jgi:hypothetical protein
MTLIEIPKYLHELHGKQASVVSLVLVYSSALFFGIFISTIIQPLDLAVWKSILLFIIVADIAGGAIANFTTSTRQYYIENKHLQLPFLLMHIIHPFLLFLLIPNFLSFSIFMGLFILFALIILKILAHYIDLMAIAVFLFVIGITIILQLSCTFEFLKIIPILFFLKLILGFAVGVFSKEK